MELFWLEHKKSWRKKIVKICVLLCFVYCVIFGSILSLLCLVMAVRVTIIPPRDPWPFSTVTAGDL